MKKVNLITRGMAVAGLTAVAVAGCTVGSTVSASSRLSAASANFSKAHSEKFSLSVSPTQAQIQKLAENAKINASQAAALITSSRLVIVESGINSNNPASKEDFSLALTVADKPALEVRLIHGAAYAHLDTTVIENSADKVKSGTGATLKALLAEYTNMAAGASPLPQSATAFSFIKDMVDGKWVGVDANHVKTAFTGLQQQANKNLNTKTGSTLDAKTLLSILKGDTSVQNKGKDAMGNHLVITAPAKKIAQDISAKIGNSADFIKSVPNRNVTIDVWVKNSEYHVIQFDANQLTPEDNVGAIPVRIDISMNVTTPKAPLTYTPINVEGIKNYYNTLNHSK